MQHDDEEIIPKQKQLTPIVTDVQVSFKQRKEIISIPQLFWLHHQSSLVDRSTNQMMGKT